jgi:type III secretion protein R
MRLLVSSFVSIPSVPSLVSQTFGVQQGPPNMVHHDMATMLTIYSMYGVMHDTFDIARRMDFDTKSTTALEPTLIETCRPLISFLERHTKSSGHTFFLETAQQIQPQQMQKDLNEGNSPVRIPAFVVSELIDSFQLGFLLDR